jgi:Tfp pilus assembly protein PilN
MSINLLPWRENHAHYQARCYLGLLAFSVTLIVAFGLGGQNFLIFLKKQIQPQISLLKQQINAMHTFNTQQVAEQYQILSQQIKFMEVNSLNQSNFWHEFDCLQKQIPFAIQLMHLSWHGPLLTLQGAANRSDQVGILVHILENSQFFSQITLEKIDSDDQTNIHFSIHAYGVRESIS